jgi:hypothetical protein
MNWDGLCGRVVDGNLVVPINFFCPIPATGVAYYNNLVVNNLSAPPGGVSGTVLGGPMVLAGGYAGSPVIDLDISADHALAALIDHDDIAALKIVATITLINFTFNSQPAIEGKLYPLGAIDLSFTVNFDIEYDEFVPSNAYSVDRVLGINYASLSRVEEIEGQLDTLIKDSANHEGIADFFGRLSSIRHDIHGCGDGINGILCATDAVINLADPLVDSFLQFITIIAPEVGLPATQIYRAFRAGESAIVQLSKYFPELESYASDFYHEVIKEGNLSISDYLRSVITTQIVSMSLVSRAIEKYGNPDASRRMIANMWSVDTSSIFDEEESARRIPTYSYYTRALNSLPGGLQDSVGNFANLLPDKFFEGVSLFPVHGFCVLRFPEFSGTTFPSRHVKIYTTGGAESDIPIRIIGEGSSGFALYEYDQDFVQLSFRSDHHWWNPVIEFPEKVVDPREILMGKINVTREIMDVFLKHYEDQLGSYNLFSNNCQHQAKEVVQFAEHAIIPKWMDDEMVLREIAALYSTVDGYNDQF